VSRSGHPGDLPARRGRSLALKPHPCVTLLLDQISGYRRNDIARPSNLQSSSGSLATMIGNLITGLVALVGVILGGLITTYNQERLWRRDEARRWRETRLTVYTDFLAAYRQYISFALYPEAVVDAKPHPHNPEHLMPFFDDRGLPYKEKFEASKTAARLLAGAPSTYGAIDALVRRAREVAAARSSYRVGAIPVAHFDKLWQAERKFITCARNELGLPVLPVDPRDAASLDLE